MGIYVYTAHDLASRRRLCHFNYSIKDDIHIHTRLPVYGVASVLFPHGGVNLMICHFIRSAGATHFNNVYVQKDIGS